MVAQLRNSEAVQALGIPERTARRYWAFAASVVLPGAKQAVWLVIISWPFFPAFSALIYMAKSGKSLRALFDKASEIKDEQARRAFLDKACAGDAVLRANLEELLQSG